MAKKGRVKENIKIEGQGKECPKCKIPMQRRKRIKPPKDKIYYFREWDYCPQCSHVQHYEEFKSYDWVELEEQDNLFRNLK